MREGKGFSLDCPMRRRNSMAKLPIGISDFKKIIEEGYQYVDKTLLIEELKRTNGEVILIPRPRRFGKNS